MRSCGNERGIFALCEVWRNYNSQDAKFASKTEETRINNLRRNVSVEFEQDKHEIEVTQDGGRATRFRIKSAEERAFIFIFFFFSGTRN